MKDETRRAFIILHFCVFLWGFTAILGNLITLKETVLVWYRMGITSASLLLLPAFWKDLKKIKSDSVLQMAGIGVLVALHWVSFYGAIKYSVVSVALICLATISLFTAIIEPLFFKSKIKILEIISGIIVILAMLLIFYASGQYAIGIILGIISSLLAAIFTVLNKKMMETHDPVQVTCIEISTGFVLLSVLLPIYGLLFPDTVFVPQKSDIVYLLILSLACTSLPFVLSLQVLKHISAFSTNLAVNLEPVYGIILGIIIFKDHQHLSPEFFVGSAIILLVVFLNPLALKFFKS
jgi:drug/metabolite transporter (DMT)-like permease